MQTYKLKIATYNLYQASFWPTGCIKQIALYYLENNCANFTGIYTWMIYYQDYTANDMIAICNEITNMHAVFHLKRGSQIV